MRKLIIFVFSFCALLVLSSCIVSHDLHSENKAGITNSMQNEVTMSGRVITVGDPISAIKKYNKDSILLEQYCCIVWEDSDGYNIACTGEDGKTISVLIRFSKKLELLDNTGADLIEEINIEEWVGKKETDFISQYGPCHVDFGCGSYIPSYISKNGIIYFLNLDDTDTITCISSFLPTEHSKEQGALYKEDD